MSNKTTVIVEALLAVIVLYAMHLGNTEVINMALPGMLAIFGINRGGTK